MVYCAVFNCNSNNNKRLIKNSGASTSTQENIHLFRFPKDLSYAKIWVNKCGRKDKFNIKNSFMCSKHFTKTDYARNLQHELLNYSPKNSRKLKPDAIPSENLPTTRIAVQTSSKREERQQKRKLKSIVPRSPSCDSSSDHSSSPPRFESVYVSSENVFPSQLDKAISTSTLNINEKLTNESTTSTESLIKENRRLLKECDMLRKENSSIKKIFTPTQRKKLQCPGKRIKWGIDDISNAMAIYSSGPKVYQLLLKKNYPFPTIATLRKWTSKTKIIPI